MIEIEKPRIDTEVLSADGTYAGEQLEKGIALLTAGRCRNLHQD